MNDREVEAFYRTLSEAMPGRTATAKGPKDQPNPFRTCISCMCSAQSLDRNTAAATRALFRLARTPQSMARLPVESIAGAIRPCGLYNRKAQNILAFCNALIQRHEGRVPNTREALMQLPGIGRKCADIVLQFAFGIDTIAVDTHVYRVCNRTGLAPGTTADKTADTLLARTPGWALPQAHFWLIQFGKTYCTARAPRCEACPANTWCRYYRQSSAASK